jgi:hypothetical protein
MGRRGGEKLAEGGGETIGGARDARGGEFGELTGGGLRGLWRRGGSGGGGGSDGAELAPSDRSRDGGAEPGRAHGDEEGV